MEINVSKLNITDEAGNVQRSMYNLKIKSKKGTEMSLSVGEKTYENALKLIQEEATGKAEPVKEEDKK